MNIEVASPPSAASAPLTVTEAAARRILALMEEEKLAS
jgi:hypothetical protein